MRRDNYNQIARNIALKDARALYKKIIERESKRTYSKRMPATEAMADVLIIEKTRLDNLVRQYKFTREELKDDE